MRDAEKQLEEEVKIAVEWQWAEDDVEKLRNRIEQVRSQINNIEEEHGSNLESKTELQRRKQLKKNLRNDIENTKNEFKSPSKN